MELVEELVDYGNGECVLDGEGVEGAVVDAEPPRAVAFLTRRTGEEKGESLRRTTPCSIIAAHWRSSSSLWAAGYRYGRTATGAEPGLRTIAWSRVRWGGRPVGSVKMSL